MDKKIHKKINIMETVLVLVGISCMCLAAVLHFHEGIRGFNIYNILLFVIGLMAEVGFVSIELILFHLENRTFKFLSVGYYIMELVLVMLINATVPFSGLVVLTLFSIIKNMFRTLKADVIYKPLGYYELCKKFGIKVKKPRKARVSTNKKSTATVKSTGKTKSSAKSREPEYA